MIGSGRRAKHEYPRSGQTETNGMKTSKLIMAALVAAALAGVVVGASGCKEKASSQNSDKVSSQSSEKASTQSSGQAVKYTCSMHPDVVQDKPGNCPKCGMALTEKR